jgi:hypothetical protein
MENYRSVRNVQRAEALPSPTMSSRASARLRRPPMYPKLQPGEVLPTFSGV